MSNLIARILLAILMFPLASLVYLVLIVLQMHYHYRNSGGSAEHLWVITGALTWLFIAVYWYLLWRKSVRFVGPRVLASTVTAFVSAGVGVVIYFVIVRVDDDVAAFVGTAAAPLLWLTATCFIWRETADERAARLSSVGRDAVVCPNCGYNLTGLSGTRCPECGKQYTINELLAEQPARAAADVEAG